MNHYNFVENGFIKNAESIIDVEAEEHGIFRAFRRLGYSLNSLIFMDEESNKRFNITQIPIRCFHQIEPGDDLKKSDTDSNDEEENNSKVKWIFGLAKSIISIILAVLDIGTDLYLGYTYFLKCQSLLAFLTLFFVFSSTFINMRELYCWHETFRMQTWKTCLLMMLLFITHVPLIILGVFLLVNKYKHKIDYVLEDSFIISESNERYLEATPQLIIQLSVLLNNEELWKGSSDFPSEYFPQIFSIVSSIAVISWGIRDVNSYVDGDQPGLLKSILLCLAMFPIIGSRILAQAILCSLSLHVTILFIIISRMISFLMFRVTTNDIFEQYYTLLICTLKVVWNAEDLGSTRNHIYTIVLHSLENMLAAILWLVFKWQTSLLYIYYLLPVMCLIPYFFNLILYYFFRTDYWFHIIL